MSNICLSNSKASVVIIVLYNESKVYIQSIYNMGWFKKKGRVTLKGEQLKQLVSDSEPPSMRQIRLILNRD